MRNVDNSAAVSVKQKVLNIPCHRNTSLNGVYDDGPGDLTVAGVKKHVQA